jgi:hypothetical protein
VAFLVLVTGLLLWRRNGPTAFASALIFLSAFGAFLLIPLRPALTALGISALTERLPNPGEAASAFCFLMASFGLITRDTAGRRVLAGILAVAGIAAPFTPLASYLPDTSGLFASAGPGPSGTTGGAGPASTAGGAPPETIAAAPAAPSRTASGGGVSTTSATSTTPEFTIELPSGWKSATGGDPAQLLTAMSEDGAVVLSVAKEVVPAQTLFDALAETKLAQARARMARASGMIVGVPGRKDRKRLFIMADKQVLEQLLVLKQETCLTVACQGNHAAIQMHRAELDRIFLTFEPR